MTTPANLLKFVRKKDDTVKKRFERCCEKKPASLKNENSVSTVLTRDTVPSREGGGHLVHAGDGDIVMGRFWPIDLGDHG